MGSLDQLSSKDFDPKTFINGLCESKPEDASLDRFLTDHEMKLHIAAEDLGLYLHEESLRSTVKLPSAARELARIKEEVSVVKMGVESALRGVESKSRDHQANGVYLELQQLVELKTRMESARDTLQEAASLSSMFKTIDSMLHSNDLVRLADALQRFNRGLAIVGDSLVEFKRGRDKVANLEERVLDLAVQKLDNALKVQNGDHCRTACSVLDQLDRSQLIAQHYSKIRSEPLIEVWDGYSPENPYVSWIPGFYDEVLRSISTECDWCESYLPEYYPSIVLDMLISFFRRIEVPCKARLAGATSQSSISSLQSIEAMAQSVESTADFVDALFDCLRDAHALGNQLGEKDLLKAIIVPYDDVLKNYPAKESSHMKYTLEHQMGLVTKSLAAGVESKEDVLEKSLEMVFGMVVDSVQRCFSTTRGTSLPEIVKIIDGVLETYISTLARTIKPELFYSKEDSKASVATHDFAAMLFLPPLLAKIEAHMAALHGQVKDRVRSLSSLMEKDVSGEVLLRGSEFLNVARLSWNIDLKRSIDELCSKDDVALLGKAEASLQSLSNQIDLMIEKSFTDKLEEYFGMSLPREYSAEPKAATDTLSFSAYPLQYVISAGEQLMMLPQLFETAWGSNETEENMQEDMIGDWIDRLAASSASLYAKYLGQITSLPTESSRQLTADIEYFCNILSSLGQEIPVSLSAWQAALAASDSEAMKSLISRIDDTSDGLDIVMLVSKLRNIDL